MLIQKYYNANCHRQLKGLFINNLTRLWRKNQTTSPHSGHIDLKKQINLCLGLKSKKVDVENLLLHNDIGILCLQEVEIESSFNAVQQYKIIKNFDLSILSHHSQITNT